MNNIKCSLSYCFQFPKYINFSLTKKKISFLSKKNFCKSTDPIKETHQCMNHPKQSILNVITKNNQISSKMANNYEDKLELLQKINKLIFNKGGDHKEPIDFDALKIKLSELIDICEEINTNNTKPNNKKEKIHETNEKMTNELTEEEHLKKSKLKTKLINCQKLKRKTWL